MEVIKLDLIPSGKMPSLHASQYDKETGKRLELCENRVPYELDGTETLSIIVRKVDNTLVSMDIANVFGGKTYVDFLTTEQMCACAGYNFGELRIERNGERLGTGNFYLCVEEAPDEGGITSQSEINNLNRQIADEVDRILPDMVDEVAEPIINEKVPEKVAELVPSAVAEVAEPIVREIAPQIVEDVVPTVIGDNYYNKTQTNLLLDNKANAADVYTKSDLSALTEKASFKQLLDKSQFIAGKKLQTTALVSTPEDMVDDPYYTVTNIIELDWDVASDVTVRTLATNLKLGDFIALGYIWRNGQWVRSAYVTAVTQVDDHYTFDVPVANAKLRLSIYSQIVDVNSIIITKADEWTTNPRYGKNIAVLKDQTVYENSLSYELRQAILPTNPCLYKGDSARVFKNILCIGDSLTEGAFNYGPNGTTGEFIDGNLSYPAFLKTYTGRGVHNAGDSGQSTKTWWERHQSDDLSGYDACIIELGLNDVAGREEIRCTSAERITAVNNIVSKLKSENTGIKIFISSVFNVAKTPAISDANADLKSIADTTPDCYYLDLENYGTLVNDLPDRNIHLTAIGYEKFAREYFNYLSYIIDTSDKEEFAYVQFIGTNYTPT